MCAFAGGVWRGDLFWFGVVFFVVPQRPLIDHNDGVFGDKVSLVPVVLCDVVVCAEFIRGTPAESFFAQCTDVRQIGFIVKGGCSVVADDTVQLFLTLFYGFGVGK